MNRPLVTIAITACNDERHLAHAIDSVLGQEGIDKEVLVVDDGSTDNTDKVLERYAGRMSVYRHHTNLGLVTARRTALANARGEWITMVDGDDWLSPHAIERALWDSRDVDIVQMHINLRLKQFPWIPINWKQRYEPDHALDAMLYDEHAFPVQLWGKLYRPDLLLRNYDTIIYGGFWGEDRLTNLPIMLQKPKVTVCHNACYNYRLGGRSRMRNRETMEQVRCVSMMKRDYMRERGLLTPELEQRISAELDRHIRYLSR